MSGKVYGSKRAVDGVSFSVKRGDILGILEDARVSATLRREKGQDIDAACGQLRLKTEKERAG